MRSCPKSVPPWACSRRRPPRTPWPSGQRRSYQGPAPLLSGWLQNWLRATPGQRAPSGQRQGCCKPRPAGPVPLPCQAPPPQRHWRRPPPQQAPAPPCQRNQQQAQPPRDHGQLPLCCPHAANTRHPLQGQPQGWPPRRIVPRMARPEGHHRPPHPSRGLCRPAMQLFPGSSLPLPQRRCPPLKPGTVQHLQRRPQHPRAPCRSPACCFRCQGHCCCGSRSWARFRQ
mmetsp:Transcript_62686/g.202176  ORF Transcript_62686/g.202176 Transcript_62686/m.202176 type:complete len:227 (+) Transcript_62686:166-846(+)